MQLAICSVEREKVKRLYEEMDEMVNVEGAWHVILYYKAAKFYAWGGRGKMAFACAKSNESITVMKW